MVILVTGATAGLGRWVVSRLVATGATVVVHGRTAKKAERTHAELVAEGADADLIHTVAAELGDLHQVDELAGEVIERFDRLDVLVNNAGIGFGPPGSGRAISADGYELRFAVNYLAGYHLTRRLLPLLVASRPARVVNVSSIGQQPIDFADVMLEHDYDGVRAYRQSKLAQIMFTFDLAEELAEQGVTVTALHPATLMDTPLVREAELPPRSTVESGGIATVRLAIDPDLAGVTGRYYDQLEVARANDQAYDTEARAQLRQLSDELIRQALG